MAESIVYDAVTGPWGVVASYNESTGLVEMALKYKGLIASVETVLWVNISHAPDSIVTDLSAYTSPKVQAAFIALGYDVQ